MQPPLASKTAAATAVAACLATLAATVAAATVSASGATDGGGGGSRPPLGNHSGLVRWNQSFAKFKGDTLVDAEFGNSMVYASLGGHAVYLDNTTGAELGAEELPDGGCYIWTSRASVFPLPGQPGMAVLSGGDEVVGFNGTDSFAHHPAWTSPHFPCPYIERVSANVVVVNNFTAYGFVSTTDGRMLWEHGYTTYEQYSDVSDNIYMIEPPREGREHPTAVGAVNANTNTNTTTTYALVTEWGDYENHTTVSMFNAVSGERLWQNTSTGTVSWFEYDTASDLLLEANLPDLFRARDWRRWDAPAVWDAFPNTASSSDVNGGEGARDTPQFQSYALLPGELVVFFADGGGHLQAVSPRTGKLKWAVKGTGAVEYKANLVFGGPGSSEYFYLVFSADGGASTSATAAAASPATAGTARLRSGCRGSTTAANATAAAGADGGGEYVPLSLEKRRVADGALVWRREDIARTQYGWVSAELSEDGSLLYLWHDGWLAALDVSETGEGA